MCSPGSVDQAALDHRGLSAPASWALRLKACITMPGFLLKHYIFKRHFHVSSQGLLMLQRLLIDRWKR